MTGHPDLDTRGQRGSAWDALDHEDAVGGNEPETIPWKFYPCLWGAV